jgi:hypothetical protein
MNKYKQKSNVIYYWESRIEYTHIKINYNLLHKDKIYKNVRGIQVIKRKSTYISFTPNWPIGIEENRKANPE